MKKKKEKSYLMTSTVWREFEKNKTNYAISKYFINDNYLVNTLYLILKKKLKKNKKKQGIIIIIIIILIYTMV